MFILPIRAALVADTTANALLGSRSWEFGSAPSAPDPLPAVPYLVWQMVSDAPYTLVDVDAINHELRVQFDVYDTDPKRCIQAAQAARSALFAEHATFLGTNSQGKEQDSKLYRVSFDMSVHASSKTD